MDNGRTARGTDGRPKYTTPLPPVVGGCIKLAHMRAKAPRPKFSALNSSNVSCEDS